MDFATAQGKQDGDYVFLQKLLITSSEMVKITKRNGFGLVGIRFIEVS